MTTRLSEPRAWLVKVHLRHVPQDLLVATMGNGKHFTRLADNSALVRLQDKAVSFAQLRHLVFVRLLDRKQAVALNF